MIRALFSAGSGMSAQQTNVDNIAHNLANANTVGFKMRRAQFQDLLYQNLVQPGAAAGTRGSDPRGAPGLCLGPWALALGRARLWLGARPLAAGDAQCALGARPLGGPRSELVLARRALDPLNPDPWP